MSDFVRGLAAPFRAVRLLATQRQLRRLAMMPLAVNIVIFLVGVPLAVWGTISLVGGLVHGSGFWGDLMRGVAQVLAAVAVIFASFFLFVIIGNIVAAPFNSKLSAAVEAHLTGVSPSGNTTVLTDATRSVTTALGRLVMFLLLYPPIFLTQFIPIVGVLLQPLLAALYAAFMLSIDFSDFAFERHIDRFGRKVGFVWRRKPLYLGFGLVAVAMAIVPIINLLLLPVGVVAATILYIEETAAAGSGDR